MSFQSFKQASTILFTFMAFTLGLTSCAAASYSVYRTSDDTYMTVEQGLDELALKDVVVLGETHYEEKVQEAEAMVLEGLSMREPKFQLAWEFLNTKDQMVIDEQTLKFTNDAISGPELMTALFGNNGSNHEVYLPLFEVAKKQGLRVLGTNADRALKQRLMAAGRDILTTDSEVWPFSTTIASAPQAYFERFEEVMGGHADTQTLEKYYLAQYYTDAYMANSINEAMNGPVMMVVGHFHSDYNHGLPFYMNKLGMGEVVSMRLLDTSSLSEDEIKEELKDHAQYGALGEYVLLID